jgi:hypothetical protein
MPSYQLTPFRESTKLLVPGLPSWLLGSYLEDAASTFGYVVSNSAASTIGSLVFQITQGNIPIVGSLITVRGTANSGGVFNVVGATVLTVSTNDYGTCSVTYAISSTTQASTADNGQVLIPQIEVGETLVAESSIPVAMPYQNANANLNQALTAVVAFPSLPTSVIVSLQQAVFDKDSEYATVAVVATVSGGAVTAAGSQITVDPTLGRFFRFSVGTVVGGTLPTIVAKLLL